jgi:hypothetical protein
VATLGVTTMHPASAAALAQADDRLTRVVDPVRPARARDREVVLAEHRPVVAEQSRGEVQDRPAALVDHPGRREARELHRLVAQHVEHARRLEGAEVRRIERDRVGVDVHGVGEDLRRADERRRVHDVGAGEGAQLQHLGVLHLHLHGRDVAREVEARAVGRDGEYLGDGRAAEVQRVLSRPAVDDVAVVAGIPDEDVRRAAAEERVDAVAAGHDGRMRGAREIDAVVAQPGHDDERGDGRRGARDRVGVEGGTARGHGAGREHDRDLTLVVDGVRAAGERDDEVVGERGVAREVGHDARRDVDVRGAQGCREHDEAEQQRGRDGTGPNT